MPAVHAHAGRGDRAAALLDTLEVLERTPAARRVLVFDDGGTALPTARGGGRLRAGARRMSSSSGNAARGSPSGSRPPSRMSTRPPLLVGMDTPQLTRELLIEGIAALARPGIDAVIGPSPDGGYWSIGLTAPARAVFSGSR